jgi:hypothetical protein
MYEGSIKFLKEFQEIIYDLFVHGNSLWKPYQRGVILATETVYMFSSYIYKHTNSNS